jgi:hypothetical protein
MVTDIAIAIVGICVVFAWIGYLVINSEIYNRQQKEKYKDEE